MVALNNRQLLLTALLVCFALPHACKGLNFGFGGGDDASNDDDVSKRVTTKKQTHGGGERKFKFHKIERHSLEDDENDEDDEEDGSNNNKYGSMESNQNVDEEYQFLRVRKAQKDRQNRADHSNGKIGQQTGEPVTSGFFGIFFESIFGGANKNDPETLTASKSKEDISDEQSNSNSIINWFKWIADRSDKDTTDTKAVILSSSESWLSYFHRWPFNSLFPIGKPAKPISMPRQSAAQGNGGTNSGGTDTSYEEAPMSQHHLETLLHTLPGFVVNASLAQDLECRQQLQIFQRQLRGHKLWPLQMLDATGKIPSGVLRGNINQFGDFDLCTHLKTVVKVTPSTPMRIRGKYCLAHIETQAVVPELKLPVHLAHGRGLWNGHLGNPSHFVPRYAVANWGVCIPHACGAAEVQQMLQTSLRPYNATGVEFHVDVDDNDCYMRQSRRFTKLLKKDSKFRMTIFCVGTLTLLMSLAFIYECRRMIRKMFKGRQTSDEEGSATVLEESSGEANDVPATIKDEEVTTNKSFTNLVGNICCAFSPKRTISELLSRDGSDLEFPIIHVLKLAATFMIYLCLKYLMIGHLPITNRDKLVRVMEQPLSILFRTPIFYSDLLLLLSGFLSASRLCQEMERKSYIQLLKGLSAKMGRLVPTMYVVLLLQTWLLPYLGSGPLWSNLIGHNAALCAQQMWRNALSLQNAIDFEETCSPMTIQLALEVQLYVLGPLIVWLYYTDSDAGFLVYGALQALSVGTRFARTHSEHLSMTLFHGINVSKFYRTANILYSSPISRATPYLLGVGAGLLQRTTEGSFNFTTEVSMMGWLLSLLGILWCFWSPAADMRTDFIYSSSDAAAYAAWNPLILGLAFGWVILMFPKKENSVLSFIASSRPVLFLSRICFPMQLVMYGVVFYHTASVKEPSKYQITDLINFNEISFIILLGTVLTFLIDMPSRKIRHLIVDRIFAERLQVGSEPVSGAELSESDDVGDAAEDPDAAIVATSETKEPIDDIWGTDIVQEDIKEPILGNFTVLETVNTGKISEEEDEEEGEPEEDEIVEEIEAESDRGAEEDNESEIAEEDEVKKRP